MQDSLPAGGLRLYREGVEPSGSLRKVSGYITVLLSRTCPVARIVCNNLESSCVRSGCGHAWTSRRDFAVSKSVGSVAFKRRAHTGSHSASTPSERVTGRPAVRLVCKRSRTAFTSRSRCCEYRSVYALTHRAPDPRRSAGVEITRTSEPNGRNRNGQGARLDTNFRPQNYGAVGNTLLATTR